MPYYLEMRKDGPVGIWLIESHKARRVAAVDDSKRYSASYDVLPGEEPLPRIRAAPIYSESSFHELKLQAGEFYPRMARPDIRKPNESPGFNPNNSVEIKVIEAARGQLAALKLQLEAILRVVHPVEDNLDVYGHEIRNLLMLAATEVESQWKGVLIANGVRAQNTHDYVKLSEPMKLSEYEIVLPFYPWLSPIRPFDGWRPSSSPTRDLPWYAAYNSVKHDRERSFHEGSLRRAIEAVCGCAVMIFAQFGTAGYPYREEINSFFELSKVPIWTFSDAYCLPYDTDRKLVFCPLKPIPYPF
jgi:hypothetical protein